MTLLPDGRVHLQPNQFPFRIVVEAAPPALPLRTLQPQNLYRPRRILEWPPCASSAMVEHRRSFRQGFAILFRCPQPGARRQNVSEILGQALIHPEQIANHRILIIARRQSSRTPVFAIPRMGKLMRQQSRFHQAQIGFKQRALFYAVVARLMMFNAVMTSLIAEREKKMIFKIVTRAE